MYPLKNVTRFQLGKKNTNLQTFYFCISDLELLRFLENCLFQNRFLKISIKKKKKELFKFIEIIFSIFSYYVPYIRYTFFFFGKQRTDRNPLFIDISRKPVFFCCLKNRQHNGQTARTAWCPMERTIFINATENYVRRTIVIY